jgi:hypothetical protein
MIPSIGNFSSIAPLTAPSTKAAPAVQSPESQAVKDSLNISQQGQAASAKVDSDGDHDGS